METEAGNSSSPSNEAFPPPQTSPLLNQPNAGESISHLSTTNNDGHGIQIDTTENCDLDGASANIAALVDTLSLIQDKSDVPQIPQSVETFTNLLESHIEKYDAQDSSKFGQDLEQDVLLINGIGQLSKLNNLLHEFSGEEKVKSGLDLTTPVLQRGMAYMEKELRVLLQEGFEESRQCEDDEENTKYPRISQDTIQTLRKIVGAMISGGYHRECCQAYTSLRKDAAREEIKHQDVQNTSNEDLQKKQWEALEGHIVDWVKVVKHVSESVLPGENRLCVSIFFPEHSSYGEAAITNLAKPMVSSLLNLAEAVSMTTRSAERLFKVLDIYEAITDLMLALDASRCSQNCITELRSEISVIRRRMREAIVGIFSDLESSIKKDAARNPVPGGGVHPLTRYVTNYLRYACDFRDTLEHVFWLHENNHQDEIHSCGGNNRDKSSKSKSESEVMELNRYSSFAAQLVNIMELLDENLEAKSRLYKDPSLRYIFLMNNGRYILQKIKESMEIREVMGDELRRKRSSELRGYHRSYQRETWSRVLQCLNQEGLQANGKVQKSLVKERLKSFNQMFDEISKTQSGWVLSDKQLQSELRVSISAVMIPAYRSFVARFGQCIGPRKQAEKYIKYQPEDIEASIEALFDGNGQNLSVSKKRLSFPH